ncbi:MAG TPA: fumarate/nitrate reduction transcriptional regulator Fnr [Candidatus Polarisedimenticolia bacterium]|nr:fumarate/nitrate reduction transcriptional regulator Fnr [Candidatus Polarisedimenticolia bacterium]
MQHGTSGKVINIASLKAACKDCNLRELCLPVALSDQEIDQLASTLKRRYGVHKGEVLYRAGDKLRSLFAVRRGAFKTSGVMEDGRVHVTGFFLAGEILGFDAITRDVHPCTAEALETSDVCEIPFDRLEELGSQIPGLQRQLMRIMSRELLRDEQLLVMLGRMSAEERFASFLLSFSRRQARQGRSETDLSLAMSRQDIGYFLGLALETISRLFSRFQEQGLIEVIGRQVRLLDIERVRSLANADDAPSESIFKS